MHRRTFLEALTAFVAPVSTRPAMRQLIAVDLLDGCTTFTQFADAGVDGAEITVQFDAWEVSLA